MIAIESNSQLDLYWSGGPSQVWSVDELALLRIIVVEIRHEQRRRYFLLFTRLNFLWHPPPIRSPILCNRHPGSRDLESTSGRRTMYDLIQVSEARFREIVLDGTPHNSFERGTLRHDTWMQ